MSKIQTNQIQHTANGASVYTLPQTDGSAGQVLKTDGSGNLSWVTLESNPITMVDRWRLTTSVTGNQNPITSYLARSQTTSGTGFIGTGMSVSSGIFTFPSTGIYQVEAHWSLRNSSYSVTWMDLDISFHNGSNYAIAGRAVSSISDPGYYSQAVTSAIVDVQDTSVNKVRFITSYSQTSHTQLRGSGSDYTYFNFIRLGDT
jgi:hypothetical protein